jgi:hypothetical protein
MIKFSPKNCIFFKNVHMSTEEMPTSPAEVACPDNAMEVR